MFDISNLIKDNNNNNNKNGWKTFSEKDFHLAVYFDFLSVRWHQLLLFLFEPQQLSYCNTFIN